MVGLDRSGRGVRSRASSQIWIAIRFIDDDDDVPDPSKFAPCLEAAAVCAALVKGMCKSIQHISLG